MLLGKVIVLSRSYSLKSLIALSQPFPCISGQRSGLLEDSSDENDAFLLQRCSQTKGVIKPCHLAQEHTTGERI